MENRIKSCTFGEKIKYLQEYFLDWMRSVDEQSYCVLGRVSLNKQMKHQIKSRLCQVTVKKSCRGRTMFTVFECSPCLFIQQRQFISLIYSNTSGWRKYNFFSLPQGVRYSSVSCILDRKNWPHSKYTSHTVRAEEVMDYVTLYEGKINSEPYRTNICAAQF